MTCIIDTVGRLLVAVLLLTSCSGSSSELAIDRVDPNFGPSTSDVAVRIEGAFHMPLTSNLDQGDTTAGAMTVTVGGVALVDAIWRDEQLIEGTVRAGLPSGPADVEVTLGGRVDVLVGGYVVDGTGVTGDSRQLTIEGSKVIGGPHADFPVVVALTDTFLKATSGGGNVAHPMGFDIQFSEDANNTVRYSHEIERYDAATGQLIAWVKIPMLTTSTTFYIHAGDSTITTSQEDPAGVWSAGFAGVWHFDTLADSTGRNPGTDGGTTMASGQIEGGRGFTGPTSVISVAPSPSINDIFAGGGTAEAWFFATGFGDGNLGRLFDRAGFTVMGMCSAVPGALLFGRTFSIQTVNWCTPTGSLTLNQWFHAAVVYNDDTNNPPTIFINGVAQILSGGNTVGTKASDVGATLTIGDRADSARTFQGTIDEVRLSRAVRSSGWIATSHENQRDPATFCTFAP